MRRQVGQAQDLPQLFKFYVLEYLIHELAGKRVRHTLILLKRTYYLPFHSDDFHHQTQPFQYDLQTTRPSQTRKETSFKRKVLKTDVDERAESFGMSVSRTGSPQFKYFKDQQDCNFIDSIFQHQSSSTYARSRRHATELYGKEQKMHLSPISIIDGDKSPFSQLQFGEPQPNHKSSTTNAKSKRFEDEACCVNSQAAKAQKASLNLLFLLIKRWMRALLRSCFAQLSQNFSSAETPMRRKQQMKFKQIMVANLQLKAVAEHLQDQLLIHKAELEIKKKQLMNFERREQKREEGGSPQHREFRLLYEEEEPGQESKINKKRKLTLKKSQVFEAESQLAAKTTSKQAL